MEEDIASTRVETYVEVAQVHEYSTPAPVAACAALAESVEMVKIVELEAPFPCRIRTHPTTQRRRLLTPMCLACAHLCFKNETRMTVFRKLAHLLLNSPSRGSMQ